MQIYFKKDIGGRDEQQDSCIALHNNFSILLVLGDGMGGHKGGSLASKTLIEQAKNVYNRYGSHKIEYPQAFFQEIVDSTQKELKKLIGIDPSIDPHTTCVLALIQDGKLHTGHIGDSRMYFFADEKFIRRSKDHSVVQMLLNEGEITEDQMATHPDQNKLLKSISAEKEVKVTYKVDDLYRSTDNVVLICSDGFWEQISPVEMQKYIFASSLKSALTTMVKSAKVRGGSKGDNISVVAYRQDPARTEQAKTSKNFQLYISAILVVAVTMAVLYFSIKNDGTENYQVEQLTSQQAIPVSQNHPEVQGVDTDKKSQKNLESDEVKSGKSDTSKSIMIAAMDKNDTNISAENNPVIVVQRTSADHNDSKIKGPSRGVNNEKEK